MTKELITQLSYEEAQSITAQIRDAVENVWDLLKRAHDGQAWSAIGHKSWDEYVKQEFQMSKRHANRLLNYADIKASLEAHVGPIGPTPETEGQGRPLTKLEAPEQQQEAWAAAVETAKSEGKEQPTAKHVEAAVSEVMQKDRPTTEHLTYQPANGLMYADNAISQLKKIKPNDTERTRAFNRVCKWISENK